MRRKLKCEVNTRAMEERVLAAFLSGDQAAEYEVIDDNVSANFEHGQWWITDHGSGAQWSVVDARGGSAVDGFDFELVSMGDR